MGIGAGIGAFATGLASGLKTSSELQDATERRGVLALQKQQAQMAIDTEKAYNELSGQIANEVKSFADMPNKDDPDMYDAHYSKMSGLLRQQAILTKKYSPEFEQSIEKVRKEKFAERVFQGTQLLKAGDVDAGMAVIKPVYNRVFKDGNTLDGATYDQATDTLNLNFTRKDGTAGTTSVNRTEFANRIAPLALNVGDAYKFEFSAAESAKDRASREGTTDKEIAARKGISTDELAVREKIEKENRESRERTSASQEAGAERRTRISADATVNAAKIGRDARGDDKAEARLAKDFDDFQKQINDSLGWNKNNPLTTPDELARRNKDAAAMTGIWNTTKQVTGRSMSAYEAAQIIRGIESGQAKFAEKDGHRIVDVNGVRAVMPPIR
jgi:hypothetical protein